ncbi:MAG: exodeoxyribonuclease VII large subunit [Candidatus Cloacimonetes bacterium 4572_55]|nr:MAG: exodeoxyribonuclease VII large subunit [Candidatus Cloacimonetes bacterium 4572_55]
MFDAIIYQVGELTDHIKKLLQTRIGSVWVEGEISNYKRHSSGHLYFSLKDHKSRIQAVMFRSDSNRLESEPEDGLKVIAQGELNVYERSGLYQIIVRRMQPVGVGELQLAFEQLKAKLASQGLFNKDRKKPIPRYPKRIGVVTSPTGAAIRDIVHVVSRRWPRAAILLAPVQVQGIGAASEIARAIQMLNQRDDVDVIIVGRGGGSIEDLWAFNEEAVCRALFESDIPTISAVGHEIDFTLSDFTADLRAPTPSAAAESVVPDREETLDVVNGFHLRLKGAIRGYLLTLRYEQSRLVNSRGFRRPIDLIRQNSQNLDHLTQRLRQSMTSGLKARAHFLDVTSGKLEGMNPDKILRRGYAVCRKLPEKNVITDSDQLNIGDMVELTFATGKTVCQTTSTIVQPTG